MLKNILRIIKRDGLIAREKMAAELKISKEAIDEGIFQLLNLGYLAEEKTGADCVDFCSTCPFAKSCHKEVVKTFKITEKGERYLQKIKGA